MKPVNKQLGKKTAFTIVELLTVMSIIVILIGILVPSLNMAKRYAKDVKQRAQFHSIGTGLELFSNDWDGYPPSDAVDEAGADYCGAMKLCEAMVGQDLLGFHSHSHFRSDCTIDGTASTYLYATPLNGYQPDKDNLKLRKSYLQLEFVNTFRLWNIYGTEITDTDPFDKDLFVLCDVYNNVTNADTGKKIGMPILYYKANASNTLHDPNGTFPADVGDYIYNYLDNDTLIALGPSPHKLGESEPHPFLDPYTFYETTRNKKINVDTGWPYRPDSYLLISAGFDGIYGTPDDIFNFQK